MGSRPLQRDGFDRGVLLAALGLVVLAAGLLLFTCFRDPSVSFLGPCGDARWIAYPQAFSPRLIRIASPAPQVRFDKEFSVGDPGGRAVVRARALRELTLWINDVPVVDPKVRVASWRQPVEVDLSAHLRRGRNTISAGVRNPTGPPVLCLSVDGLEEAVATDGTWTVQVASTPPRSAAIADEFRGGSGGGEVPSPLSSMARRKLLLLVLFVSFVGISAAAQRLGPGPLTARLPWVTASAMTLAWLSLGAMKLASIPVTKGFDSRFHVEYVLHLLETGSIPLATDGWSMYHPPLFHAIAALVVKLASFGGTADVVSAAKLVPFAAGLSHLWLVHHLARRVFPDEPAKGSIAVVAAGLLPISVYMSAYVSNEPLHAALAACCVLATVVALRSERATTSMGVLLGALIGLALLTKFTALLVAPLVAIVVAAKVRWVERASAARVAWSVGVPAACAFAIAGWFYVRNVIHFGRPLVDNGANILYWQYPGFRTGGYFTRFGEVLVTPYFAGFRSFWDGVYSTFWGDGLLGGAALEAARTPVWNYEFMSIGYLLALPLTLILVGGVARLAWVVLSPGNPRAQRLALAFLVALILSALFLVGYYALRLPYWTTAKASYGLYALGPLSLALATGVVELDRWLHARGGRLPRLAYHGWLGTTAAVLWLSFAG